MEIGEAVIFADEYGEFHAAIVTQVWDGGGEVENPSVNLVFVTPNENSMDQYGRQLERKTSVVHASKQYAHGMFYRTMGEVEATV
jgi:hypothetical protein